MLNDTKEKIMNLLNNDVITSEILTKNGIRRAALTELVENHELIKCSRGVYIKPDGWVDEYFLLQNRYKQGVFSHGTSLYLLGYSERVPQVFYMTFPNKYNCESTKKENVIVKRVIEENYRIGLTKTKTPFGNEVFVYDLERSICDMFKGNKEDIQIAQYAIKKYLSSNEKDINKLMKYAKILRVEKKIRNYVEVFV